MRRGRGSRRDTTVDWFRERGLSLIRTPADNHCGVHALRVASRAKGMDRNVDFIRKRLVEIIEMQKWGLDRRQIDVYREATESTTRWLEAAELLVYARAELSVNCVIFAYDTTNAAWIAYISTVRKAKDPWLMVLQRATVEHYDVLVRKDSETRSTVLFPSEFVGAFSKDLTVIQLSPKVFFRQFLALDE